MDPQLSFGKIYVVEWLTSEDAKTGRDLFGEIEPLGLMSKPPVESTFKRAETRKEFIDYLRWVRGAFRLSRRLPLLHIESHGLIHETRGAIGIGSSADDAVLWPELMRELLPLNELTRLRLIVVLAACEGLWGMSIWQPAERAAALALLGPRASIGAGPLATAMQTFYRSMFLDRNGNLAFTAMNDAVDPTKPSFGMVNAEMAFKWVYGGLLKRTSPEELNARAEAIVQRIRARFSADYDRTMPALDVMMTGIEARKHVRDQVNYFRQYRREYFFIDRFPENDARFAITYEDCLNAD